MSATLVQYVDDGLTPYTYYSYTLSACTIAGCTRSGRSIARTSEHTPSALLPPVTKVLNSTAVQVTWTSPAQPNGRITQYDLLVNSTLVYSGLSTTYVVTDLLPYVLYEFVIRACTSAGCTDSQSTLSRPDEALPSDLAAPSVQVTGTRSTEVSWSPPMKPNGIITAYELRRNDTLVQLTTNTWFLDYDCMPGTSYAYYVRAYNSKGGVNSPTTFATTFSSAPEGVSTPNLTVLSSSAVAASWHAPISPNGKVVNYTLYQADRIVYTGLSMSTVVSGLSPWTIYSFRVSACTQSGCARSLEAQAKTLEASPTGLSSPRLTAVAVGQVLVKWTAPQSPNGVITRYDLHRRLHSNDTDTTGLLRAMFSQNIISFAAKATIHQTNLGRIMHHGVDNSVIGDGQKVIKKRLNQNIGTKSI